MIEDILRKNIEGALTKLAINSVPFKIEHPSEIVYGDYSTNVAMVCAKEQKQNPYDVALSIKAELEKENKAKQEEEKKKAEAEKKLKTAEKPSFQETKPE
jgi:arginyl-tRNA synthetase